MNIIQVTSENTEVLEAFLQNELPASFRYFKTRPLSCVKNHIITLLCLVNNAPIAYGHLDKDDSGKIWMGVCVLKEHQSKGYGKTIVNNLLEYAQHHTIYDKIFLAVDKDNERAISLYEKTGFIKTSMHNMTDSCYIMERKFARNSIFLPVSFGEAFDKLSILYIKLMKITDSKKLAYVEHEYNSLFEILKPCFSEAIEFHFNTLISINNAIWCLQDCFREESSDDIKNSLCTDIIFHNDRRFRVKHKIDSLFPSQFKEQKGYTNKSVFILSHLGMGDHLTHIGLYRYLSTLYDRVTIVVKKHYVNNMKMILSDDKCIDFYECDKDADISPLFGATYDKFEDVTRDYDAILTLGFHKSSSANMDTIPFSFYSDAKIDSDVFWEYYFMQTHPESIKYYEILKGSDDVSTYIFIHNTCSSGEVFDFDCVEKCLGISRDDILFLSVGACAYEHGHKFFDIANKFIGLPLPYYKIVMENAAKIVVSDSSFFCMGLNLSRVQGECYYVNVCGKTYEHVYEKYRFNETLSRPIFKNLFDGDIDTTKLYYSKLTKSLLKYTVKSRNSLNGIETFSCNLINGDTVRDFNIMYDSSLNAIVFSSQTDYIEYLPSESHKIPEYNYGFLHDNDGSHGIENSLLPMFNAAFIPEICIHILANAKVAKPNKLFAATTWISGKQDDGIAFSNFYWPVANKGKAIAPVHFVSFASSNIFVTLQRIMHQATHCGFFESVHGYTERDIADYIEPSEAFFRDNKRMFGYGIWKPYIIKRVLDTIPDGEFVFYCDAGCSINPMALSRFNEYLTMCKESPHHNVCMHIESEPDGKYQEQNWTKEDVLAFFNMSEENRRTPQICGGFWLIQKCPHTVMLVEKWLALAENHAMWDDSPSTLPNHSGFFEHRHCQSMLSCLLKTHGTRVIEKNEFDSQEDSWRYPFWATRIR